MHLFRVMRGLPESRLAAYRLARANLVAKFVGVLFTNLRTAGFRFRKANVLLGQYTRRTCQTFRSFRHVSDVRSSAVASSTFQSRARRCLVHTNEHHRRQNERMNAHFESRNCVRRRHTVPQQSVCVAAYRHKQAVSSHARFASS